MAEEKKLINSESKVENDNLKIVIGTVDKKSPIVDYIEISGYMVPDTEESGYANILNILEKQLKRAFNDRFYDRRDIFETTHMFLFEVADKRIKPGKKSYFTIQTYFKLTDSGVEKIGSTFKSVVAGINEEFNEIFNQLPDIFKNGGFSVSKTKS